MGASCAPILGGALSESQHLRRLDTAMKYHGGIILTRDRETTRHESECMHFCLSMRLLYDLGACGVVSPHQLKGMLENGNDVQVLKEYK
jgi:hypothetical protein